MITGKYKRQGDDLQEPLSVRQAVFGDELGWPLSALNDGADGDCIHAVAYDEQKQPVATGRLQLDEDGRFHIAYVAVLADKRRQGLGDFIVRLLLDRAFLCGTQVIQLMSTPEAVPFFETIGFGVTGERTAAGVPMTVRAGQVKTACGGH